MVTAPYCQHSVTTAEGVAPTTGDSAARHPSVAVEGGRTLDPDEHLGILMGPGEDCCPAAAKN